MGDKSETFVLLSNIIDQNYHSHCRLCLKLIEDENFARFLDGVAYSSSDEYLLLGEVLCKIFGEEICSAIPGVDAVCSNCLDQALETLRFIRRYEASTLKLNKVIDNFNASLNFEVDVSDKDQVLYILSDQEKPHLIFVQNKHEVQKPISKMQFKCYNCNENYNNIDDFKQHNLNQHETYTCEKCLFTSINEDDIAEHEDSLESYGCKDCPQFRCTEESLKEHEEGSHGLHVCKECGKLFKGLDKLLAHEEKHISKNVCPICGKSYTTKYYTKHVKLCLEDRVDPHPMRSRQKKRYVCQTCNKGYSTPGGLRVHERFEHGNATPHICSQCGKKFTAPCYLKVHMVTHTKERNFPCNICNGKFVSKEALLYHRRRHTGEKPYSCDICSEKFVNASARAEHIKFKHVGPTLGCELCHRKFVTKNFLRLHIKKHHDPTNKLYIGRSNIPPNVPGEQNMRVRISGSSVL